MNPWVRRSFALALPIVVLGIAELWLRSSPGVSQLLFPWERQAPLTTDPMASRQDGPYRWELQEGSNGFRVVAPVPGATRSFLLAGDSWAWGYGVSQGKTLADRLAVHLSEALGTPVQVWSSGRPGTHALEIVKYANLALREHPEVEGVLVIQPHNPRRRPMPGRVDPPPHAQTASPPNLAIYRAMRLVVAPYVWDHAPTQLEGPLLTEATEAIRGFATTAGRPVWLLLTPQEVSSATTGRFGPEPVFTALGVPWAGHALTERSCWSWTDAFHPSEAGTDAIALAVAPLLAGGASGVWTTQPSCDEADGRGPGKE